MTTHSSPTPAEQLEAVLEVGARMLSALDAGNVDDFYGLVLSRGTLLQALSASPLPADEATRRAVAARFEAQSQALEEAAARFEERLRETLREHGRFKAAGKSYSAPPVRAGILHRHVRG